MIYINFITKFFKLYLLLNIVVIYLIKINSLITTLFIIFVIYLFKNNNFIINFYYFDVF